MADFKRTLIRLTENLQTLQEREAKYGGNTPVELLNQIADHRQAITLTEQAIQGDLTEAEWRAALEPLNLNLSQTTNNFQIVIQSLPRPVLLGLGAALLIILAVGVINLEPVRMAVFPTATPTVTPTPSATPLPFAPAASDETLILIATFYRTEGVADTDAHNEIRRAIENAIPGGVKNLRVEVEPTRLTGDKQEAARKLGEQYGASVIIWGTDTGVRVTVNFLNLKEPDYEGAAVQINETERTQLANPSAYARFITNDLPGQLTFLALFAVGQSYFTQTDYAAAIRLIDRAVAALPAQLAPPQGAAEAYFRLGWLYQNQGQKTEAIANYSQAIELDPQGSAVAYNNRAIAYHQQGDIQQALADYNQAIELDPGYAPAYNNRGIAYFDQQDYPRAVANYTKAIELDPQLAFAFNNRGNAYKNQGDIAQAITDFDQAIKLNPTYIEAYNNRANAYTDQGDFQRAIADYTWIIDQNPEYVSAYINRGIVYDQLGDYPQAASDYTKAIELEPANATAYAGRGLVAYRQGNYQPAIDDYSQAIKLDPQNETAYYNRGLAYADLGNVPQAIADYTQALALNPQDADAYYFRGAAYAQQGDAEPAIADYSKVIEFDPDADTYTRRGQLYFATGNDRAAIADLTRATELAPTDATLWATLCRMGGLAGAAAETMAACEQAVKLAPTEGSPRDSRGLARALTGDDRGAIEDFQFFVQWSKQNGQYEQLGRQRETWITQLQAGQNPFDQATLAALRQE